MSRRPLQALRRDASSASEEDAEAVVLLAPLVGQWRDAPAPGTVIAPGSNLGRIGVLGVFTPVVAPAGAYGVVRAGSGDGAAVRAVSYGGPLLTLDARPDLGGGEAEAGAEAQVAGLVYRAPSGGRFYRRTAPDKPPLLAEGDVVGPGSVVGLVEVMKSFHRLAYEGDGLPPRARVVRFLIEDGADMTTGDPIFELEPAHD
ncbi:MAG: hypothetical protein AAF928_18620 [Myxococcota bacterium]